jgi:hypothetical protein
VDVADVAGIMVPWNDDNGLAVDPVEVVLGERVLLLEPERGQVTSVIARSRRFGRKNCVPQCRSEIWMIVNVPSRVAMREV